MNKIQNEKQKPNHGGNNISHSWKWQELELQIWKVTSGVLQSLEPRITSSGTISERKELITWMKQE